ncbi:MAG: hypothetical protein IT337_08195 [Thermomicrobiales bacterium]|nr:hypothetical protein [Thermomicrobiales bacterium]
MQQSIRYYIQKTGELPVVRTVPVSVPHCAAQSLSPATSADGPTEPQTAAERGRGVARIREAIRRGVTH